MRRPNFGKPPPGYVAGLGRGATGFTTRSDIGPARQAVGMGDGNIAPPGFGRGMGMPGSEDPLNIPEFGEGTFNQWSGYEGSLFANAAYDNEDREADEVSTFFTKISLNFYRYSIMLKHISMVEEAIGANKNMEKELEKIKQEAPKYQQQFADLKRQLANVTREEWESIPEDVDHSGKRVKSQRYTPTPDNLIDVARMDGESVNFLDPDAQSMDSSIAGYNPGQTPMTNLSELGEARKMNLGLKLDKMSSSVMGTTAINKNGYLTDLNALKINSATEINDIRKAKLLMKSIRKNDPNSPIGWISSARIEELDGKIDAAREIIGEACDKFPLNEDVWAEAARLMPAEESRRILVTAITNMPKSKKLWMACVNGEKDKKKKVKILRKALNSISNDVELWKAAIELEEEEEAKSLLYKAVECVPYDTNIWIALAKLEDYEKARKVLNRASKKIPTDHTLWVHAAKLEEARGEDERCRKILFKGMTKLRENVTISKDQWLKEAYDAEMSASVVTARAIIECTIGEKPDEDSKNGWYETAENFLHRGAIECARACLKSVCLAFPKDAGSWMKAINLEEEHGNSKTLGRILKQALESFDESELFYLMYAKHLWKKEKNIDEAIKILKGGLENIDDEEELYLALVKLYKEKRDYSEARKLLIKGRQK
jgi:pre-mRNA-processing factor 6